MILSLMDFRNRSAVDIESFQTLDLKEPWLWDVLSIPQMHILLWPVNVAKHVAHPLVVYDVMGSILGPNPGIAEDVKSCDYYCLMSAASAVNSANS